MYSYKDLEKAPVGTKITFKNDEEILVKTSEYTIENENRTKYLSDYKHLKSDFDDLGKIIKTEEPAYTTVYEVKDILDEEEKEWLSAVLKPARIRNNVKYITKHEECWGEKIKEYLVIANKKYYDNYMETFAFDKGTMYKNMELDKEYTLEELGL